jgi:hypothetical protein
VISSVLATLSKRHRKLPDYKQRFQLIQLQKLQYYIKLQHSVAPCNMNYYSHFLPFLRNFVDVLKFTFEKHSSLPIIRTLHVSAQLSAIIRSTGCRGNCCPLVTQLHTAAKKNPTHQQNRCLLHAKHIRSVGVKSGYTYCCM